MNEYLPSVFAHTCISENEERMGKVLNGVDGGPCRWIKAIGELEYGDLKCSDLVIWTVENYFPHFFLNCRKMYYIKFAIKYTVQWQ